MIFRLSAHALSLLIAKFTELYCVPGVLPVTCKLGEGGRFRKVKIQAQGPTADWEWI